MTAVYLAAIAVMLACLGLLAANEALQQRSVRQPAPRARLAVVAALLAVSAELPVINIRPPWRTVQIGATS